MLKYVQLSIWDYDLNAQICAIEHLGFFAPFPLLLPWVSPSRIAPARPVLVPVSVADGDADHTAFQNVVKYIHHNFNCCTWIGQEASTTSTPF